MLEEEARQLRNSLVNEKNRNARLMRVIEQRRYVMLQFKVFNYNSAWYLQA